MTAYVAAERRRTKDAAYRKERTLRQLRGQATSLVPADRARDHAVRLTALGWSSVAIQQAAGEAVSDTTVINLINGRHATLERNTAAAIMRLPYTLAASELLDDGAMVPMLGAQRRVQSLLRIGWTHPMMRAKCGVDTSHLARGTYSRILARKWRAVDEMFRELCVVPGPSRATRERAQRMRYAPPFAWDDIDDPNEKPQGLARRREVRSRTEVDPMLVEIILAGEWSRAHNCTRDERREVCRRWVERGGSLKDLEGFTGWNSARYYQSGTPLGMSAGDDEARKIARKREDAA